MQNAHEFAVSVEWTGDRGSGTSGPRDFGRDHRVSAPGHPDLVGSAARPFHGDASRWNPEEMVIAALAQCHLLSYLYAATRAGVVVTGYHDDAQGTLRVEADGSGRLVDAVLRPRVRVAADPELAESLHAEAHRLCFIANSVAFPVRIEPSTELAPPRG